MIRNLACCARMSVEGAIGQQNAVSSERMEDSFHGVSTSQRQTTLAPAHMSSIESRHIHDILALPIYEKIPLLQRSEMVMGQCVDVRHGGTWEPRRVPLGFSGPRIAQVVRTSKWQHCSSQRNGASPEKDAKRHTAQKSDAWAALTKARTWPQWWRDVCS